MIEEAPKVVTWIKVEKPNLDIIGLVLRSLATTGVLSVLALLLGALLGLYLIRRRRRSAGQLGSHLTQLGLPTDPRGDQGSAS